MPIFPGSLSCCPRLPRRRGEWGQVPGFLDSMRRAGINPDKVTFNTAIAAVGAGGEWETAMSILAEMKAAGLSPDAVREKRGVLLQRISRMVEPTSPMCSLDWRRVSYRNSISINRSFDTPFFSIHRNIKSKAFCPPSIPRHARVIFFPGNERQVKFPCLYSCIDICFFILRRRTRH